MPTTLEVPDLIKWLVAGLAAVVMFLLSLGIKDIRERIKAAEGRAMDALATANSLEARVKLLEKIIEREK